MKTSRNSFNRPEGKRTELVPTCEFCDEFNGGTHNSFARIYRGNPASRTVLETPNFKVVPSLGQINEGHLLILPVAHFTALADLAPSLTQEVVVVHARVWATLNEVYGACISFEHGSRCQEAGGCGIYHAHMHVVPLPHGKDVVTILNEKFCSKPVASFGEVSRQVPPWSPYLYYEDTERNRYVCEVSYLPSQYIRRLVAQTLEKGEWDWRRFEREEAVLSTAARLSGAFGQTATFGKADGV